MPIYRLTMVPSAILLALVVALFALLFHERPAPIDANGGHVIRSEMPAKDQSRLSQ